MRGHFVLFVTTLGLGLFACSTDSEPAATKAKNVAGEGTSGSTGSVGSTGPLAGPTASGAAPAPGAGGATAPGLSPDSSATQNAGATEPATSPNPTSAASDDGAATANLEASLDPESGAIEAPPSPDLGPVLPEFDSFASDEPVPAADEPPSTPSTPRHATASSPNDKRSALVLEGRSVVFSSKYSVVKDGAATEYVRIGNYDLKAGGTGTVKYFLFNAADNKRQFSIPKQHAAMNAHARPANTIASAPNPPQCTKSSLPIYVPGYSKSVAVTEGVTWTLVGGKLTVKVGKVGHEWALQEPPGQDPYFTLARPYFDFATNDNSIDGDQYAAAIGYAYPSDPFVTQTPLVRESLLNSYRAEFYQKNTNSTGDLWWFGARSLSLGGREAIDDRDVLSEISYCPHYKGGVEHKVWCQSSVALNVAPFSKNIVYLNGGHDYNENGCLDETDHSYMIYAAREDNRVDNMVFIEYSFETDGYPIMIVGRYHRPSAQQARISADYPIVNNSFKVGSVVEVRWGAGNQNIPAGASVSSVNLWKGPKLLKALSNAELPAEGTFRWTVAGVDPGVDYRVQVILYKNGAPLADAYGPSGANEYFKIVP